MIKFFNINSGERVSLDNPHLIAAYINSSDMHVNSGQGQDFGWRISPEDIARIDLLKADPSKVEEIARHLGKPAGDIKQVDFVKYVSYQDDVAQRVKDARADEKPAYQAQYEAEIAAAKKAQHTPTEEPSVAPQTETAQTELPVAPIETSKPKSAPKTTK